MRWTLGAWTLRCEKRAVFFHAVVVVAQPHLPLDFSVLRMLTRSLKVIQLLEDDLVGRDTLPRKAHETVGDN